MPIDPKQYVRYKGKAKKIGPSLYTPWGRFDLYIDLTWAQMRGEKKMTFKKLAFFTTHNKDVTIFNHRR
jgi:hypothetical protein